jgi:hypothetical protein
VSEEGEEEEAPRNIITGEVTRHTFEAVKPVDLSEEMKAVELEVAQAPTKPAPIPVPVPGVSRAAQFAQLLKEKQDVRRAVVLAELLSAPKGLR